MIKGLKSSRSLQVECHFTHLPGSTGISGAGPVSHRPSLELVHFWNTFLSSKKRSQGSANKSRNTEKWSSMHIFTLLVLLISPSLILCIAFGLTPYLETPGRSEVQVCWGCLVLCDRAKQLGMLVVVSCSCIIVLLLLTDGAGFILTSCAHMHPFR